MRDLFYQELKIQNKIFNVFKFSLLFFGFCVLSISLVSAQESIHKFGVIFSLTCIPLSMLSLSNYIIKQDIEDGTLEISLASVPIHQIIFSKLLAIIFWYSLSYLTVLPIIYIFFSLPYNTLIIYISSAFLLLSLSASLIILIASIQGYFRSNTNFLAVLIMPIIIPNIILSGLAIENADKLFYIFIMFGINLILIPLSVFLSCHLTKNIYNI